MQGYSKCDLLMVGRAAMGNPWVFSGKKPSDMGAIKEMLSEHFELLLSEKGERRAVMEMRKHFAWYTKGLRGAAESRQKVNTAENAEEIKRLIDELE